MKQCKEAEIHHQRKLGFHLTLTELLIASMLHHIEVIIKMNGGQDKYWLQNLNKKYFKVKNASEHACYIHLKWIIWGNNTAPHMVTVKTANSQFADGHL